MNSAGVSHQARGGDRIPARATGPRRSIVGHAAPGLEPPAASDPLGFVAAPVSDQTVSSRLRVAAPGTAPLSEQLTVDLHRPPPALHPTAASPGSGASLQQEPQLRRETRQPRDWALTPHQGVFGALGPGRPSLWAVLTETGAGPATDLEEEAERLAPEVAKGTLDTTGVRVRHGPDSALLTAARGADAVTVGTDVHLAPDHPPLTSQAGRLLLAHELVHVWQQTSGRAPYGRHQARETKKTDTVKTFEVRVDREMGPDELLREFVKQYYRLNRPADIDRVVARWHWIRSRSATAADRDRRYVVLEIHNDPAESEVAALSDADRNALNAETDRRFFEETGLPSDTRLGAGPEDSEQRARWRGVRANLLAEHEQARALRDLPGDIKKILFAGGRTLRPDEYSAALEIADRLGRLSPMDRVTYLGRINASTDELTDLAEALSRFERHLRMRAWDEEAFEEASVPLEGMGELYRLYKAKEKAKRTETLASFADSAEFLAEARQERGEADQKFAEALSRSRFSTEADFLAAIDAFLHRFRTQAVNLAKDVLASYDHLLYVARLKYSDPEAAEKLVADIAALGAAADYRAAREAEAHAELASMPVYDHKPGGPRLYPGNPVALRAEAKEFRASGSAKVVAASDNEPIIDPAVLGRKTDREHLAAATPAEARAHLLQVIADRLTDAADVRGELTEDPDRVYSQESLIQATMEQYGIDTGSVYGEIIADHITKIRDDHIFSQVVLGIIGLVLAVLVPGGGWLAAAAMVAGAGIGAYQALDALAEYNKSQSEYALGFISEEPSLFWVGVAVAGAAFELGLTAGQLFKLAAPALLKLQRPLIAFAEATGPDVAVRLRTLKQQIDAVEGMEEQLRAALKAQAERQSLIKLMAPVGLRSALTPIGVLVEPAYRVLAYLIRRGVRTFTAVRKEKELIAALEKVTGVEGAGLPQLRIAFSRVQEAVRIGEKTGMDEATLLRYVDRIAAEHNATDDAFKVITKEMRSWRAPTAEQRQAELRLNQAHEQLLSLRQTEFELETQLAAMKADRLPRSQVRATDEELKEIKELRRRASENFERAMEFAQKVAVDPKLLMRRAFDNSAERAAVLAGAKNTDQVGQITGGSGLRLSSGTVEVDHIVSLQRMSEMEGFGKLTWHERRVLAVRSDNLVAMDALANRSKSAHSWSRWPEAAAFYDQTTIIAMRARDADLTARIQEWILTQVQGR